MRDSALILFHGRSVVVDLAGNVSEAESLRRFTRRGLALLGTSLGVFALVVAFSYGRTIAAHTSYYAKEARRSVLARFEKALPKMQETQGTLAAIALAGLPTSAPALVQATPSPTPDGAAPAAAFGQAALALAPSPTATPTPVPTVTPSPTPPPTRIGDTPAPSMPAAAALAAPTQKPAPKSTQTPHHIVGTMTIEKLGVQAPVVVPADPSSVKSANDALHKGVIVWAGSEDLGTGGTTIVLGHSSAPLSYRGKYGATFAMLEKLVAGDMVTVAAADGATYTYRVRDHIKLNPKKEQPDLMARDGETLLLVSCWPVGTNWGRIVVRADRVVE